MVHEQAYAGDRVDHRAGHHLPQGPAGAADRQSHPTWGTISIDDIYTDSRSGQRHFTVHTLVGDKILIVQPAVYDLAEFKVA